MAFKVEKKADFALALLTPSRDKEKHRASILPSAEYHARFQTAAWSGLGVAWLPEGIDPTSVDYVFAPWKSDVVEGVTRALRDAARNWGEPKDSRAAESCVREALKPAFAQLGYSDARIRRFVSYFRRAITDGVWRNEDGHSICLEVKLNEDWDAPFGQIIDDLTEYDAVVHVRVGVQKKDGAFAEQHARLRREVGERLPVLFYPPSRDAGVL